MRMIPLSWIWQIIYMFCEYFIMILSFFASLSDGRKPDVLFSGFCDITRLLQYELL